ncbi:MAG: HlyD family secretion protein, partial [Anaerolineae bacterium]
MKRIANRIVGIVLLGLILASARGTVAAPEARNVGATDANSPHTEAMDGTVAASADLEGDTPQVEEARTILVEGTVAPERSSALQFVVAGEVSELLVSTGDEVAAGDPLVKLDDNLQALAVAHAASKMASAEARLSLAQAGPRAEEVAVAEADLASARSALRQAAAARDELAAGALEAETAGVQAVLEAARARRRQVEAEARWAEDDEDFERRDDLLDKMHAIDVEIAAAEARLAALPVAYAARLRAANAGVRAAQAQVATAEAGLALAEAGPTAESIAVARAAVQQAEADLAETEIALARTMLHAPFEGTITQVLVEPGEAVAPGMPVVVLADLTHLRIETTDLTELDIVHVHEGQPVEVTLDAMPESRWSGHVVQIKQQSLDVNGDVTYPAIIELDENVPGLRWGMSAAVTFVD